MISYCLYRVRYVRKVRQREAKDALWCEIKFKNSRWQKKNKKKNVFIYMLTEFAFTTAFLLLLLFFSVRTF